MNDMDIDKNLLESMTLVHVGGVLSVLSAQFGGEVIDRLISGFVGAGMYEIAEAWQTVTQGSPINLFYIMCTIPLAVSIVIAFLRTPKKGGGELSDFVTKPDEV